MLRLVPVSISSYQARLLSQRNRVKMNAHQWSLCRNRWLGDWDSRLFGSSKTAQSGLEFYIASNLVSTVTNTSWFTNRSPRMSFIAVRALLTNLSHASLACKALGTWNIHWHPFGNNSSWICLCFQSSIASLISLSVSTKLVPESE